MYWLSAYNTPPGGRTFSLETDDPRKALELSLQYVKSVVDEDNYLLVLENLINQLGWHIEYKDE